MAARIIRRPAPPPGTIPGGDSPPSHSMPAPPPTAAPSASPERLLKARVTIDALSEFYGLRVSEMVERAADEEILGACLAALTEDDRATFAAKPPTRNGKNGKYRPAFHCRLVLLAMGQGAGISELPLDLGLWPTTVEEWRDKHPEFCGAVRLGSLLGRSWWERVGRRNLWNPEFNNVLYMMNMSNRYGWTRKVEGDISMRSEHTEKRVAEINVNVRNLDDRTLESVMHLLESSTAEDAGT